MPARPIAGSDWEPNIRIAFSRKLGGRALEILLLGDSRSCVRLSEGMTESSVRGDLDAFMEAAEAQALLRRQRRSSALIVPEAEYIGSLKGFHVSRRLVRPRGGAVHRQQQLQPGETFYLTLPISMA